MSSELLERLRAGDDGAYEQVVHQYGRRLIRYCAHVTGQPGLAEDLAQDALVKLYLARDRLDAGRPLVPFLFRIAHNHCVDWLKRRRVGTVSLSGEETEEGATAWDPPAEGPDPEQLVLEDEAAEALDRALHALPVLYRSALVLRHVEGLGYEEIAGILEAPLGTVKARIHRGRELLQQRLAALVSRTGGKD